MFDIIGQENQKKLLQNAFDNKKISHAYLIIGPDGTGKSIFAMHMAAKIMCTNIDGEKPCGVCNSCAKISKGLHPDVRVVSEDKRSIGIDRIRGIIEEVNTRPFEAENKVIVIKRADKITTQAQNALLKTLEEPPIDTYMIMTAENDANVLDTIKSRCQVIKFERVSQVDIKNFLIKSNQNEELSSIAASLSDGIVGDAIKYTDEKFMDLRKQTIENSIGITHEKTIDALQKVDFFMKNKKDIDDIFIIMNFWYRDIIMAKLTNNQNIINIDYKNVLIEESQVLAYNKIYSIIKIINDIRDKINQFANFQLAIEVMILNIQEVL